MLKRILPLVVVVASFASSPAFGQRNLLTKKGYPLQKEYPGVGTIAGVDDPKPLLNQPYRVPVKKLTFTPAMKKWFKDPFAHPDVPNFVTVNTATITHSGTWKKVLTHRVDASAKEGETQIYKTTQTISKETADEASVGLSLSATVEGAPLGVGAEFTVKASLEFTQTVSRGEANGQGWEREITIQPGYTADFWERRLVTHVVIDWSEMSDDQLTHVYSQMLARYYAKADSGPDFDQQLEKQLAHHRTLLLANNRYTADLRQTLDGMKAWGKQQYNFELPGNEVAVSQYINRRTRVRASDIAGLDGKGYPVQKNHGGNREIPFPAEPFQDKYRVPVEKLKFTDAMKKWFKDPLAYPEIPNFVNVNTATITTTGRWKFVMQHRVAKEARQREIPTYTITSEITKQESDQVRVGLSAEAKVKGAPFGVGASVGLEASLGYAHTVSHGLATGKEWQTKKEVQPGTTAVFWERQVVVTVRIDWSKMSDAQLTEVYCQMLARFNAKADSGPDFKREYAKELAHHRNLLRANNQYTADLRQVLNGMRSWKQTTLSYTLPAKEVYVTEYPNDE